MNENWFKKICLPRRVGRQNELYYFVFMDSLLISFILSRPNVQHSLVPAQISEQHHQYSQLFIR